MGVSVLDDCMHASAMVFLAPLIVLSVLFWKVYSSCRAVRCGCGGGVFLLEVQYSILKSLISTCVLSYIGSREDWLLDRICES